MPRLTELEAGALEAWTPAQQAALYQTYLAKQGELDEVAKLKKIDEAKAKEGKPKPVKPDKVEAGQLIDDLIKSWCPPLFQFLDLFAAPHIAIAPFLAVHFAFWFATPWYLHFMIPYPLLYLIPVYCTFKAIYSAENRMLWEAWWVEIALVEYFEILLFRDTARSLVWWPKIKAILFIALYSVWEHEGKKNEFNHYGAVLMISRWLPSLDDGKKVQKGQGEGQRERDKARKDKDAAKEAKNKQEKGKDSSAKSSAGISEKDKDKRK